MELRGKSISFSSYKKKTLDKKEKELISSIEYLEGNLASAHLDEIEILKEDLHNITKNKMQVFLVRARAKIIEDDEKPTNFSVTLRNTITLVCLFDLILYIQSTIFQLDRDGSSWVEPVLS